MLNNLLAIVQGNGSSWAGQQQSTKNYYFDNFGEAALYALIGLIVIWLVGLIMRKTNNLEFLTKKREKKVKVKKETAETSTETAPSQQDEIPAEVKAAIVAAIMAYYQQSEEKCEFTVKRIKRL